MPKKKKEDPKLQERWLNRRAKVHGGRTGAHTAIPGHNFFKDLVDKEVLGLSGLTNDSQRFQGSPKYHVEIGRQGEGMIKEAETRKPYVLPGGIPWPRRPPSSHHQHKSEATPGEWGIFRQLIAWRDTKPARSQEPKRTFSLTTSAKTRPDTQRAEFDELPSADFDRLRGPRRDRTRASSARSRKDFYATCYSDSYVAQDTQEFSTGVAWVTR